MYHSSYDEPAKRSAYSIEIRHHSSYHAISNMPEASRTVESDQNYVVTKFEVIPSIQSYLIAFIISDFNFVQDAAGSVNQRVYAKPQSLSDGHGKLALEVSRPILEGFENYLGINYSLPKMDQAAMPDFDAGDINILKSLLSQFITTTFRCDGELGISYISRAIFIVQRSYRHSS